MLGSPALTATSISEANSSGVKSLGVCTVIAYSNRMERWLDFMLLWGLGANSRDAGRSRLFEHFFRSDRQAVGDIGRAVEYLDNIVAQRTAIFAGHSRSRGEFDPAEAGFTLGADDVASSHDGIMYEPRNRSTTRGMDCAEN